MEPRTLSIPSKPTIPEVGLFRVGPLMPDKVPGGPGKQFYVETRDEKRERASINDSSYDIITDEVGDMVYGGIKPKLSDFFKMMAENTAFEKKIKEKKFRQAFVGYYLQSYIAVTPQSEWEEDIPALRGFELPDIEELLTNQLPWVISQSGNAITDLQTNYIVSKLVAPMQGRDASAFVEDLITAVYRRWEKQFILNDACRVFRLPIVPTDINDQKTLTRFLALFSEPSSVPEKCRIAGVAHMLEELHNELYNHEDKAADIVDVFVDNDRIYGERGTSFSKSEPKVKSVEKGSLSPSHPMLGVQVGRGKEDVKPLVVNAQNLYSSDIIKTWSNNAGLTNSRVQIKETEKNSLSLDDKLSHLSKSFALSERLTAERQELMMLRQMGEKLRAASDQNAAMEQELEKLRAAYDELSADYTRQSDELSVFQSADNSMKDKVASFKQRNTSLSDENARLKRKNERLEKEVSTLKDEIKEMRRNGVEAEVKEEPPAPQEEANEPAPLDASILDDVRVLVVGGNQNWIGQMKDLHKNVRIYESNVPADAIRYSDFVFINADAISHPACADVINQCNINDVPYEYFLMSGVVKAKEQILESVRRSKES